MFLFDDLRRTAVAHVMEGRSVRLVGAPGSGRTFVLQYIWRELDARGVELLHADARLGGAKVNGQVIEQLGLPLRETGSRTLVAARSALLERDVVVIIDNVDEADHLATQLIHSLPGHVRTIIAAPPNHFSAPKWPQVTLEVDPLDFDATRSLISEELEGPAALSLVARVLSKSGGNPELVVALIGTARIEGLINQIDGVWHLTSASLWNAHLEPFAQKHVRHLTDAGGLLLRRVAAEGPMTLEEMGVSAEDSALQQLLQRRLIRSAASMDTEPLLYVWPPLLTHLFRAEQQPLFNDDLHVDQPFDRYRAANGATSLEDPLVAGQIFQQDSDEQSPRLLSAWEHDPSPAHALLYFEKATGTRFQRASIERVFRETTTPDTSGPDMFLFEFQRAQWLAYDDSDLNGALEALRAYSRTPNAPQRGITAASVLLTTFLDRVPEDFREVLGDGSDDDPTGLAQTARALLELFTGNLTEARAQTPHSSTYFSAFTSTFLPMIDTLEGNAKSTHIHNDEARSASLLARNRFDFIGGNYADALASMTSGQVPRLEASINATLSTARATMLLRPFFGATLNIGAITAALAHRPDTLVRAMLDDADSYVPRPGPLFGMGSDIPTIIAGSARNPAEFDRDISNAIRRRRELGYLTAAAGIIALAGAVHAGPHLGQEAERLSSLVALPVYQRTFQMITALAARDLPAITAVMELPVCGDSALLAQIVGAAYRTASRTGDRTYAARLEPLATELEQQSNGSFAPLRVYITSAERVKLSAREEEISALAAIMKNSEIASLLSISTRTVENHIANALRKTGLKNRSELSEFQAASGMAHRG